MSIDPTAFDLSRYSPSITATILPFRNPQLGPGLSNQSAREVIARLNLNTIFEGPPIDRHAAQACLAGLWLYHDFLEESHKLSQDLETPEGSYWHAIMHRREPDAWNSKYWFRIVGSHPVIAPLRERACRFGYDYSSPMEFVDFCENVRGTGSAQEELARDIQLIEWQLLFEHCYLKAAGLIKA